MLYNYFPSIPPLLTINNKKNFSLYQPGSLLHNRSLEDIDEEDDDADDGEAFSWASAPQMDVSHPFRLHHNQMLVPAILHVRINNRDDYTKNTPGSFKRTLRKSNPPFILKKKIRSVKIGI